MDGGWFAFHRVMDGSDHMTGGDCPLAAGPSLTLPEASAGPVTVHFKGGELESDIKKVWLYAALLQSVLPKARNVGEYVT